MDIKYLNPFIDAFSSIMGQIGFKSIEKKELTLKNKNIKSDGVILTLGIVGDLKGNVAYGMTVDDAKKIASTMMMGMPVAEFDDMAQSAVSELTNMLTATASTNLSNLGIQINISTPTLMHGDNFEVNMHMDKILCITLIVDGSITVDINIALDKI